MEEGKENRRLGEKTGIKLTNEGKAHKSRKRQQLLRVCETRSDGLNLPCGAPGVGAGVGAMVMPKFGRGPRVGSSRMTASTSTTSSGLSRSGLASCSPPVPVPALPEEATADLQGFTMAAQQAAAEGVTATTLGPEEGTVRIHEAATEAFERDRMGSMTAWQALADQVRCGDVVTGWHPTAGWYLHV